MTRQRAKSRPAWTSRRQSAKSVLSGKGSLREGQAGARIRTAIVPTAVGHYQMEPAALAIHLKAGRERSLRRRHPWLFSGAIECIRGVPQSGDTVAVYDSAGTFLAWAAYSEHSHISARVWSWSQDEHVNIDFFRRKIGDALAERRALNLARHGNSMRLIHAESDGLPGLVVDQYGHVLVVQIGSAGAERWRDIIADILQEYLEPIGIYERSDADARMLEGLQERNGVLRGALPDVVEVVENGLRFNLDIMAGQKTGFYLDQRDNRALTELLAGGREVLNCFCYTGGFTLCALRGGAASVLSIDASESALQLAKENARKNGLDGSRATWQCADVFQALRTLRDQGRKFDLVILDPPKFAPTAGFAEKAARGYKDINLLALKLLRPAGILCTYSCSGGVSEELFQKIIAGAALDAGINVQIVHRLQASADHPVLLSFPEGAYLKGFVLRVEGR